MMKLVLIGAAVLATATPAVAQERARASIGVTGGTLGIGPEVAYRVSDLVGVRANATFMGFGRNVDSDGIEYDGKLKLSSGGAMLDLYPFSNGFRLSAGARINSNKVRLKARPTDNVEVGDTTYTPAEIGTLSGTIKASSFAPTLTLGWDGGLGSGIHFGIDAGAMFHGKPKVRSLTATGALANDPDFQASLLRERREVEDDIDKYKIYPIVQLSLGYRF